MAISGFIKTEVKVLLVDDSPEQRQLVAIQLSEIQDPKFVLREAFRLSDGLSLLEEEHVDVALLDLGLPDAQGMEAVKSFRARFPWLPVVVLTGTDDERMAIRSLREGAEDYLVKDSATSQVLKRVLLHAMERKRLEETLASSRERMLEGQKLEALGRLAGGIAHDFNNVLVSIIGYSQVLIDELEGSDLQEDAKEIRDAGERAADLTRQILAFSRRDQPSVEPLDLNRLVERMRRMLDRLLPRSIVLELHLGERLPRVLADRGHLEQVLLNLVVNARDAIESQGKIDVETGVAYVEEGEVVSESMPGPGSYVFLRVSDTGCGIPDSVAKRIFEPFYTTKEAGKGTGLGLSTVYGIVRTGGGGIALDSTVGEGTTFSVFLPISPNEEVDQEDVAYQYLSSQKNEKVLLLEDEESLQKLIFRVLSKAGYEVRCASTREEARSVFDASVDLLLLAKNFRGGDGERFAQELQGKMPGVRTVILASHASDPGVALSQFPLLTKPFTPGTLLTRVKTVLDAPLPSRSGTAPARKQAVHHFSTESLLEKSEVPVEVLPQLHSEPSEVQTENLPRPQSEPSEVQTEKISQLLSEPSAITQGVQEVKEQLDYMNYVVSHDLREPVRMTNSFLEILSRTVDAKLDKREREFLGLARDGAARLEKMIKAILSISRLRQRPFSDEPARVSEALGQIQGEFATRAHELSLKTEVSTVPLEGEHLRAVLRELISNGFKFQQSETPFVSAKVRETGSCYEIVVEDNGVGFPEGDTARCFELFGRMHSRDEFKGVGFGLAYVQEIAQRYSGKISIERLKEGGSRVTFILPKKGQRE